MIARSHRFHGRGGLRPVYERGQIARSAALAVRFLLNERRQQYRAAVVVSKKVHKSAVVRNRIRRRIYEVLRTEIANEPPVYDLIVTVFSEKVAAMSAETLQKEVAALLKQAGAPQKR